MIGLICKKWHPDKW